MNQPLIFVCGKAGSGKSTLTEMLVRLGRGTSVSLATPLKETIAEAFKHQLDENLFGESSKRDKIVAMSPRELNEGIAAMHAWCQGRSMEFYTQAVDHVWRQWHQHGGVSARLLCQVLGTDVVRAQDPDFWVFRTLDAASRLLGGSAPTGVVIVPDCRFANEVIAAKSEGGAAILIERPDQQDTASTGVKDHASETDLDRIPRHFFDCIIKNDGDLAELEQMAAWIMSTVRLVKGPYSCRAGRPDFSAGWLF